MAPMDDRPFTEVWSGKLQTEFMQTLQDLPGHPGKLGCFRNVGKEVQVPIINAIKKIKKNTFEPSFLVITTYNL